MRFGALAMALLLVAGTAFRTGTVLAQKLKPAELDGLLAPVALYPDALLAQMLLCARNPAKVKELNQWLVSNKSLKGTELQDAATVQGFDPEFVAMTLFPSVVTFMTEQTDWTTKLGKAFAADQTGVFDSIQRLRKNASDKGTLKTTEQQTVETQKTSGGDQVIVIEPANPQVIYVPTYSPQVVYTSPPPTTVVVQETSSGANAAAAAAIGFTAGIVIGAAMDNDYYYGPYGWHGGVHMYNDAWNDYYDAREDAREDWIDHREDLVEERSNRSENRQEQRTDRTETRAENRPESAQAAQQRRTDAQAQADQRRTQAQSTAQQRQATGATTQSATTRSAGSAEARGYSGGSGSAQTAKQRSGTSSDAFSGYSSGKSERAASSRGSSSRGASRSGGGGGGGRRR